MLVIITLRMIVATGRVGVTIQYAPLSLSMTRTLMAMRGREAEVVGEGKDDSERTTVLQRLQYVVPTASRHGGEGVNDGNQCLSFVVVVVVVLSFLQAFFSCAQVVTGVF